MKAIPCLALLSIALPAIGQNATGGLPVAKAPAKLGEWPKLSEIDRDKVLALVARFRQADAEVRRTAADQIVTFGDAAAPLLFLQVTDRQPNVNEPLFAVLDRLLGPQHAALMARESRKPKTELRRYLMQRLCRLLDKDMRPVLAAAAKDPDPEVAFQAQLGLLGLGDKNALPPVLERCRQGWAELQPQVAAVLPAARSNEMGLVVAESIAKAPPPAQATGLRLMRYLATKDHVVIVRAYLQAEDHTVKKEAVNVMRALHDMPPMESLSVFQAIEMAKEWLAK